MHTSAAAGRVRQPGRFMKRSLKARPLRFATGVLPGVSYDTPAAQPARTPGTRAPSRTPGWRFINRPDSQNVETSCR